VTAARPPRRSLLQDRPRAGWLALILFAVLTFLPAQGALPVTDRDEARYVTASRQMVETGDFVDIRFQDEARHKKPVGIYWLQSAAVLASGQGIEAPLWVYRLPSLIGAVLSVLLVAAIGAPMIGRGPALAAAALFAAGFVIGGEARIAKTDAMLLATILAAQAVLARLYLRPGAGRGLAYAFWLSIAAGVLIKGPIGPLVPGLTALALVLLDRRAGWLRPLAAPGPVVLALLVAVPWFVAISLRSEGAFWAGSVGADLLPKLASGTEGKGAPPGSYLVAQFLTFWPAAPLLLLTIPAIWRARRDPATRFLLAWALPVWLVYEAIPTKLLHYTLPAYPALALLVLCHLPRALATAPRWLKRLAVLAALPGLALAGFAATWALAVGPAALWPVALGLAAALAALPLALHLARRGQALRLAATAAAAGAILHAGLFTTLARLPQLWPTETAVALARTAAAAQGCDRPRLTGWGYGEPSLVWLGGRDTRLLPAETPAADVRAPGPCVIILQNTDTTLMPPGGIPGCVRAGRVEGLAIGAGRWVRLEVLACQGTP
jgi:4-amino-4-deoxy-L-arabinose transferase-like glycosyltransferase